MPHIWQTAYVGIGSNLENPKLQVQQAIDVIDQHQSCKVVARSSLYQTDPVGFEDQPKFVNAVCQLSTRLEPLGLLRALLNIESSLGRVRTGQVNGPRNIDLDILLYESQILNLHDLILPHPRMHERRFVLQPLIELSPDIEIPKLGKAVDLLEYCGQQGILKLQ